MIQEDPLRYPGSGRPATSPSAPPPLALLPP